MKTLLGFIREPNESHGMITYLVELAKDLNTNLHLLYVENPSNHALATPDLSGVAMVNLQRSLKARIDEGKQTLKDVVNQMMPRIAGKVVVEITTAMGNEAIIVSEMIASDKVQMMAIANRGSDGFWWQDTLVRTMVRNIECPIWVIPENAEYHSFRRIIYTTDYHEEDIPTLQKLIDLTHRLSPQILALHITDNVDFEVRVKTAGFQKMLETKTAYNNISAKSLIEKNGEDLVQLINSYAAMNRADLIVVLKENKNFLDRIFNPSSSEKILKAANMPVLVYHAGQ
jgi:nucleotide-binding universal stress UspA family protein